jgi:hypothetical protein
MAINMVLSGIPHLAIYKIILTAIAVAHNIPTSWYVMGDTINLGEDQVYVSGMYCSYGADYRWRDFRRRVERDCSEEAS